MEKIEHETKRECISCEKFFECPNRKAKMEGCIHYEMDKKLKEKGYEKR